MENRQPPPTVSTGDGHVHRREGDAMKRTHNRWYDGAKAQLAIALALVSLVTAAWFGGAKWQERIRTVDMTPQRLAAQQTINEELRTAIRQNTSDIASLRSQMTETTTVVVELFCYVAAESDSERSRCQSDHTRRRVEALLRGR